MDNIDDFAVRKGKIMRDSLVSNPGKDSLKEEFINNWIKTVNPTRLLHWMDTTYFYECDADFPEEFYIVIYIENDKKEVLHVDVPLDGVSNPTVKFSINGKFKFSFEADVSICEPLLKLIKKQEQK